MIGLVKASQVDKILEKMTSKISGGLDNMKKMQKELKKKK